jgi:hypothetical protein
MRARFLVVVWLAFFSFSLPVQAAEIYRWMDEKGKVHFSDSVPEKYKRSATQTDSRRYELSEAQLREKAQQASRNAVVTQSAGSARPQGKQQAAASEEKQPDCATLRRQYLESQDCFGRFRNVNGSIKAEAFQHCTEVKDPTPQCGPMITERY